MPKASGSSSRSARCRTRASGAWPRHRKPKRHARDQEHQVHAPDVDDQHRPLQPFGGMRALEVPGPAGHVVHPHVVEDEQQEGQRAQRVDVVSSIRWSWPCSLDRRGGDGRRAAAARGCAEGRCAGRFVTSGGREGRKSGRPGRIRENPRHERARHEPVRALPALPAAGRGRLLGPRAGAAGGLRQRGRGDRCAQGRARRCRPGSR